MKTRLLLILMNLFSVVSLIGAFYYPFMHCELALDLPGWLPDTMSASMQNWIIAKGGIPVGPHYLLETIRNLFIAKEFFIGLAIGIFSIVFPVLKIAIVFILSLFGDNIPEIPRRRILVTLNSISKWSMADVFIVGMLIVFMKAEGFHFRFTVGTGLYFYAAAAILSAISFHLLMISYLPKITGDKF